ncbi:MAG: lysophospholipid acyltransferase family protein [Gemmatimonadota bacterium]|nr:lysophospholipid acyltransferase family protein [Gemmatimonadota bacterium]
MRSSCGSPWTSARSPPSRGRFRSSWSGSLLADRLADLSFRALTSALAALPDASARSLGRGIGNLARSLLGVRRKVVEDQIAAAFPERDAAWVLDTARRCYRHFGEELAVTAGGASRIEAALDTVRDPYPAREVLAAAVAGGPGAVMVTGHFGNWELAGAYLARLGFPVTAVIQRQGGPAGAALERLQGRLGFDLAYRDASPRALLRALAAGRMIALVADQHAPRGGARIDFLGRPAWTTLGPARLSMTAGAPLFFAALVREMEGYRVQLERIAPADEAGAWDRPAGREERRARELALTRRWSGALEAAIRQRPAQYYWFHRRWKDGPPSAADGGTTPGGAAY